MLLLTAAARLFAAARRCRSRPSFLQRLKFLDKKLDRQGTGVAGKQQHSAAAAAADDAPLERQDTGFPDVMAGSAAADDAPLQRQPTGFAGMTAGGAAADDDAPLERQPTGFVGLLADAWASGASPLAGMQLRSVREQPAGQHGEGEEEAVAGAHAPGWAHSACCAWARALPAAQACAACAVCWPAPALAYTPMEPTDASTLCAYHAAAGPVRSSSHTGGGESPHTASVCESPAQLPSRTSGSSSIGQRGDN